MYGDAQSSQPSLVSGIGRSLRTPFGGAMTWTQLAAVVIFVTIVLFAWRQVVNLIIEEV